MVRAFPESLAGLPKRIEAIERTIRLRSRSHASPSERREATYLGRSARRWQESKVGQEAISRLSDRQAFERCWWLGFGAVGAKSDAKSPFSCYLTSALTCRRASGEPRTSSALSPAAGYTER